MSPTRSPNNRRSDDDGYAGERDEVGETVLPFVGDVGEEVDRGTGEGSSGDLRESKRNEEVSGGRVGSEDSKFGARTQGTRETSTGLTRIAIVVSESYPNELTILAPNAVTPPLQ